MTIIPVFLPLATGTGSGAEIHRTLALVYIGGFLVAIFFVQIVFPVLYEWCASSKARSHSGSGPGPPEFPRTTNFRFDRPPSGS